MEDKKAHKLVLLLIVYQSSYPTFNKLECSHFLVHTLIKAAINNKDSEKLCDDIFHSLKICVKIKIRKYNL